MLPKYHVLSWLGPSKFTIVRKCVNLDLENKKTRHLLAAMPLFAERVHIAVLPTWHIGTKVAEAS